MPNLDMNEPGDSHNSIHTVPGRNTLCRKKHKPRLRNAHTAPLLADRTSSEHLRNRIQCCRGLSCSIWIPTTQKQVAVRMIEKYTDRNTAFRVATISQRPDSWLAARNRAG